MLSASHESDEYVNQRWTWVGSIHELGWIMTGWVDFLATVANWVGLDLKSVMGWAQRLRETRTTWKTLHFILETLN